MTLVIATPAAKSVVVAQPGQSLVVLTGPLLRVASGGGGGSGGLPPHIEPTPKTVWSIAHNLGYRPSVTVTDLAGAVVLAEVRHLSVDVLQIAFVTAQAGRAYLV